MWWGLLLGMISVEYYGWHEKCPLDYGGWTLVERQRFLIQATYWEALARRHPLETHGVQTRLTCTGEY